MNCKPGDLAVIVGGSGVGLFVRCIARFDGPWKGNNYAPGWQVDRMIEQPGTRHRFPFKADHNLRPIRDNDGEDEMLRIAGRPEALPATRLAPVDSRSNHPKESA